jgi:3'(2'), 5'-bisphosphate nucleotidase
VHQNDAIRGELAQLDDHALAERLAGLAGDLLLALRTELVAGDAPGSVLKAEGDRRSHALLAELLTEHRPDDAVLSEEGRDDPARLLASRVWIVDPLDGTREYGEPPRTDWAVHVALAVDGVATAGAVALPGLGMVLGTRPPAPLPPPPPSRPRLVVSRTRPPALTAALAEALGAELVEMGSAGAKAMAVLRGEADVYAHAGGQYEWDNCAPAAVAGAAGLHVSRIDGSPLRYNQADVSLPDLLICHPALAPRVLAAIAAVPS